MELAFVRRFASDFMEQEKKDQFDIEKDVVRKRRRRYTDKGKAPLPFRVVAWVSLIVVCFGLGYGGTSLVLKILGEKHVVVQEDVVSTPQEAENVLQGETQGESGSEMKTKEILFSVYLPSDEGISPMKVPVLSGLMEDDVKSVFSDLVSGRSPSYLSDKGIRLLHVFRNGEIMYLDLNGAFLDTVKALGRDKAAVAMTSIVRTMVENFSPVTKVRIIINGQVPAGTEPVDLSVPWQLAVS